jgi:hypothetical protein
MPRLMRGPGPMRGDSMQLAANSGENMTSNWVRMEAGLAYLGFLAAVRIMRCFVDIEWMFWIFGASGLLS